VAFAASHLHRSKLWQLASSERHQHAFVGEGYAQWVMLLAAGLELISAVRCAL
jgi:hypothetical protein